MHLNRAAVVKRPWMHRQPALKGECDMNELIGFIAQSSW